MPNYTYVVDSNFHPFSMQEMLVPLTAYKEEYEKNEEAYNELSKANTFNYLKETLPEGSKARQIYEGYAGELEKQAKDLSSNGLTMANRKAITSLKRRFNGEIGRLTRADEAMREEKKLRQSINAQDSSRLYATDNLNIDDFLDGKNPNLYNVSGNEIYARAAQAGKSISSRVFSTSEGQRLLNNYYIDLVQTNGMSQETLDKFYEDASSNPTLKRAMDDVLEEMGVPQNLTGINRRRAEKYALSGMMDGAIYQESHSPQRDLSMIDAGTQAQLDLSRRSQDMQLASQGMTYDDKTGTVTYNASKDPRLQQAIAEARVKGGSGDGTVSKLKHGIKITWNGDVSYTDEHGKEAYPYFRNKEDEDDIKYDNLTGNSKEKPEGVPVSYDELPKFAQEKVKRILGTRGRLSDYVIYYQKYKKGIVDDTEASISIVPNDTEKGSIVNESDMNYGETE